MSLSSLAALQPVTAVFREEQYFDWRVYALVVGLEALTALGALHRNDWSLELGAGLVLGMALASCLAFFLLRLTTEVATAELRVWYGWAPIFRRNLAVGEVRAVELTTFRPLADYAWGLKTGRDGERAWIARGGRGVRVELNDGTVFIIGSQRPEELASALRGAARPGGCV